MYTQWAWPSDRFSGRIRCTSEAHDTAPLV